MIETEGISSGITWLFKTRFFKWGLYVMVFIIFAWKVYELVTRQKWGTGEEYRY
jgi:hypothetical protein